MRVLKQFQSCQIFGAGFFMVSWCMTLIKEPRVYSWIWSYVLQRFNNLRQAQFSLLLSCDCLMCIQCDFMYNSIRFKKYSYHCLLNSLSFEIWSAHNSSIVTSRYLYQIFSAFSDTISLLIFCSSVCCDSETATFYYISDSDKILVHFGLKFLKSGGMSLTCLHQLFNLHNRNLWSPSCINFLWTEISPS